MIAIVGIAMVDFPKPFDLTVFIMEEHKNIGNKTEKQVLESDWIMVGLRKPCFIQVAPIKPDVSNSPMAVLAALNALILFGDRVGITL
mmetsp:Transcript_4611/g.6013  ORF Transcript_4611/g.6013 Transcript_4611/m.6013 type:complete len:88 (-) Transcript_4611:52-315(-)